MNKSVSKPLNKLILASASPRRQQLLALLTAAQFRTEPADIDESRLNGEPPEDMTVRLALLKAQTVFERLTQDGGRHAVLAGDTAVVIGDEILGKPSGRDHARAMLQRLSGNTHLVFSAVALVAEGRRLHRLSTTEVTFARIDQQQLERYCDGSEPFDKAGGYGIQGAAGAFVTHINGSYSGVVGLPLWETAQLLRELELDQTNAD